MCHYEYAMRTTDIHDRILANFDGFPTQLKSAAKRLLDHPDDVALLSMREVARRAKVTPATMTRLAQRLGFEGFDQLRQVYSDAVRERPYTVQDSFSGRAEGLLARRNLDGDGALVADTLAGLSGHLKSLSEPETIASIGRAADLIVARDRLFCIGARSSYPAAYLASYLLSLIGQQSLLVDGAGGTGLDRLRSLNGSDAVLALTIAPYTRNTVEAVAFAAERKATIVAITDSVASPIARHASASIIVPTETPSFLQTMTPAFIVVECLAALVAAKRGRSALKAIAEAEAHLDRFDSYAIERTRKRGKG
jgi:DNA-binding MurR/RpiR family transcriptional regulator